MVKSIIKEIIIILLLLLAIVLVLGVFLYDYIPTSKIVPKVEAYETPGNIKNEIEATINDEETQEPAIVYELDSSDLKNYEKSKDYQKGKVNPFSDAKDDNENNNTVNNQINNEINNNNTINNSNSVGNYLPNTGTK